MFIEDIFEKVSCYFPINFNPPKNDKFKVTPEQLKAKLKECFGASNHKQWLDNVFPFIIDKLTAVQEDTKKESLDLLEELVRKHAKEPCMKEHIEFTVSSIQNEYYNRFEFETQQRCKYTLSSILNQIQQQTEMALVYQGGALSPSAKSKMHPQLAEVAHKCLNEIEVDPSGMPAFLTSQLLSQIIGNQSLKLAQVVMPHALFDEQSGLFTQMIRQTEALQKNESSYSHDLHTAYLQVFHNIIQAANGIPSENQQQRDFYEKNCTPPTPKVRGEIQGELCTRLLTERGQLVLDVLSHGLSTNNVVFEKTLKVYC